MCLLLPRGRGGGGGWGGGGGAGSRREGGRERELYRRKPWKRLPYFSSLFLFVSVFFLLSSRGLCALRGGIFPELLWKRKWDYDWIQCLFGVFSRGCDLREGGRMRETDDIAVAVTKRICHCVLCK